MFTPTRLSILACIWKVLGLKLGQVTIYLEWSLIFFSPYTKKA